MFSSNNTCSFALFFFLLLSVNAETLRGVHRELTEAAVDLGTADQFAILTKAGISTTVGSEITGDIAVSPIAAEAMTGFDLIADSSDQFSKSTLVTGDAYAADYNDPTPMTLTTAVNDMETAYTDAAGRPNSDGARINIGGDTLKDLTLTPGVFTFSTDVTLTGEITFEGTGTATEPVLTDVFIIQIAGESSQAANYDANLSKGAKWENIFWQVAGAVEVGAGAHMEGVLLVHTKVTSVTGSSLNGRVLAQTACNLQSTTINASVPVK